MVASCSKSLTNLPEILIDKNVYFRRGETYFNNESGKGKINLECMYWEWKTQVQKVIDAVLNPTHLDGHHHLHTHPELLEYTKKLSKEFNLPVRNCNGVNFKWGVEKFIGEIDVEISK